MKVELKKRPPGGRSLEQMWRHYQLEKALATRLKSTQTREERKDIYRTMYDELFMKVPDHPRLMRSKAGIIDERSILSKSNLVGRFLDKSATVVEIGPGDCRFLISICDRVKRAYGIDISDQRNPSEKMPPNFQLILYDGYEPKIQDSAELVFSDQLIEHIHPDDIEEHFQLVRRILRPGGKYVFRTPHRFSGPHDVSGFFSDVAEGFHLCEWTYFELKEVLQACGYSRWESYWCAKGLSIKVPIPIVCFIEHALNCFPKRFKRAATRIFLPSVTLAAIK